MKICFLANGESVHTRRWVNHISRYCDTSLISFHGVSPGFNDNVNTYHIPYNFDDFKITKIHKKAYEFIGVRKDFRKILHDIQPDIIHSFYITHYGFLGALSGHHPLIISTLGSDLATDKNILYKLMNDYAIKKSDLIHVQDPLSKVKLEKLHNTSEKVFVSPWGVDPNILTPNNSKKKYDIISIRSFNKHYHVETLIRSAKIIKKQYPDIKLILLGGGERERYLKNLAKELGVFENIEFKGWVNYYEVPNFIRRSKILVDTFFTPNNNFGHTYGVGLHQAMAVGTPTVVANRPTIDMLDGEDNWYFGLTFRGGDPKELAEGALKLLKNKELRRKISIKNRSIVEKKFDISKNVKTMIEMYQDIL